LRERARERGIKKCDCREQQIKNEIIMGAPCGRYFFIPLSLTLPRKGEGDGF